MITYGEINKIKEEISKDYKENYGKHQMFWTTYQKDVCIKKYSKGGTMFPFGMYFISEVSKKAYNAIPGQFVQKESGFDFEYDYSDDGKIKVITKKNQERTFVVSYNNIIKLYKYDNSHSHNGNFPLIGVGYKFDSGENDIFVYATSFVRSNKFFFDIEILKNEDTLVKGYAYHLMSDDYTLIYGEETPNLICDNCSEFLI